MRTSGLSDADIERLRWLKYQIAAGKRSEISVEHKRLMFGRYLYEQGRLQG
jgi:hypothetical protein